MSIKAPKRRLSFFRILIILLGLAVIGLISARFTQAAINYLRIDPSQIWYAPYVDVTLTPTMHFEDPAAHLSDNIVLGFIVADPSAPCEPSWGTYYSLDAAARALDLDRRVVRLQEREGSVSISLGGAVNNELATVCTDIVALTAAYQAVIDRYNTTVLDFDIEGPAIDDVAANQRRIEAINNLYAANDELKIWLTLPVAPHGLTAGGLAVVQGFVDAKVPLAGVNVMTMNYGGSRTPSDSMNVASVKALQALHGQLDTAYAAVGEKLSAETIWHMIGATPMIGQNDVAADIFTTDDAQKLLAFAQQKELGRLSFWSINRDIACGDGIDVSRVSNTCSGVDQYPQQFNEIFHQGTRKNFSFDDTLLDDLAVAGVRLSADAEAAPVDQNENFVHDDPRTSPYPIWRENKAYMQGDKVVWQGRVYEAKWWAENVKPDAPAENPWDTPWRYLGPVLASDFAVATEIALLEGNWMKWVEEKAFVGGDEVEFNNQVFRAKWYTQGESPQEDPDQPFDHPWEYLGNINCDGPDCLQSGQSAILTVDFDGLTDVRLEIREDDQQKAIVGKLIQTHTLQGGQKSYSLLAGSYDLVFAVGSAELIIDAVDCSDLCRIDNIAATLAVDFKGLNDAELEVRQNDDVDGTAGDLVYRFEAQSGQRSYRILKGSYDLVFRLAGHEMIVDGIACRASVCDTPDVIADLTVDYSSLTDITLEIRKPDSLANKAGHLVQSFSNQRGQRSYSLLQGTYDLVLRQGNNELIVDGFACTASDCALTDIATQLTVDFNPFESATLEIRRLEQQAQSDAVVVEVKEQHGVQTYSIFRGEYLVAIKLDDATYQLDTLSPIVPEAYALQIDDNGVARFETTLTCTIDGCAFGIPFYAEGLEDDCDPTSLGCR